MVKAVGVALAQRRWGSTIMPPYSNVSGGDLAKGFEDRSGIGDLQLCPGWNRCTDRESFLLPFSPFYVL
jgi:hypothetical protein